MATTLLPATGDAPTDVVVATTVTPAPPMCTVRGRRMAGVGLTAHRAVMVNLLTDQARTAGDEISGPVRLSIVALQDCDDPAFTDEIWQAEADVAT